MMSRINSKVRHSGAFRALRRLLSAHPALFLPIASLLGNRQILQPGTDIVIDGFPRSANSFSEAAFLVAQGSRKVAISTHSHAAAQIIAAVRRGLPTLVLYRHPDQAIASYLEMVDAAISARSLYADSAAFYGPVLRHAHGIVLASFEDCIGDFASVICRVNARFGTDFTVPTMNEAYMNAVEERRDEISRRRTGRITRYSRLHNAEFLAHRAARKEAMQSHLNTLHRDPVRVRALGLHEAMSRLGRSP